MRAPGRPPWRRRSRRHARRHARTLAPARSTAADQSSQAPSGAATHAAQPQATETGFLHPSALARTNRAAVATNPVATQLVAPGARAERKPSGSSTRHHPRSTAGGSRPLQPPRARGPNMTGASVVPDRSKPPAGSTRWPRDLPARLAPGRTFPARRRARVDPASVQPAAGPHRGRGMRSSGPTATAARRCQIPRRQQCTDQA